MELIKNQKIMTVGLLGRATGWENLLTQLFNAQGAQF